MDSHFQDEWEILWFDKINFSPFLFIKFFLAEQLKIIKEVLKANPKMKIMFEQMGGFEEEFDNLAGAIFAES